MIKEVIATGVTVEAAIESAVTQLGVAREMVEIQVISLPRKGFLGMFGGNPAKIRAYYELPDIQIQPKPAPKPMVKDEARPAPKARQEEKKPEPVREIPKRETERPKPAQASPPTPAPTNAVEKVSEKATEKPERAERPERRTEFRPAVPTVNLQEKGIPVEEGSKGALARDFLRDVIVAMDIEEITVEASMQGETAVLRLVGESNGLIIGKRGETLDALQYLCSLASNRIEGDYIRVVIDSGNYRERRAQTLERLANKIAASVMKSGRSVTLEPMNPYERRIIHSTVGTMTGVKSTSIGDEPNRRVIISSVEGSQPQSRRRFQGGNERRPYPNNNKRPGGRGGRPATPADAPAGEGERGGEQGGGRRFSGSSGGSVGRGGYQNNRKPRNTTTPTPVPDNPNREKPTEATNTPIYGKIDI